MLKDHLASPCPWGIFPAPFADLPQASSMICEAPLLDKVVALVDHCYQHHDCQFQEFKPHLPSRILDIGEDDNQIRLVKGDGRRTRYLCLSYCWGGVQPLKTMSQNIVDHMASISWTAIPKLFQDLIGLARKLCIRYVWIDSLCIIQDDHEDWVKESSKMCQIYENSYLTVSATTAENCNSGLWDLSSNSIEEMEGIGAQGVHYSWLALYGFPIVHPKLSDSHLERGALWPLLDRGWAFQERTLAPRVLHFLNGEMMWECKAETFCECGRMTPYGKSKTLHEYLNSGDSVKQAAIWREIVQHYSCLKLTKVSDKLPALSGLAQKLMQALPNKRYLAGLWEDSLLEDLLWVKLKTSENEVPWTVSCPGPSWSWIAVDDAVIFATGSQHNPNFTEPSTGNRCLRKYINIIAAHCELASADRTGEVKNGVLTVEGRLYKGTLKRWQGSYIVFCEDGVLPGGVLELDGGPIYPSSASTEEQRKLHLDVPKVLLSEQSAEAQEVFCLPLARVLVGDGKDFTQEAEYAMVLARNPRDSQGYVRIGMAIQTTDWESRPSEFWAKQLNFEHGGEITSISIH